MIGIQEYGASSGPIYTAAYTILKGFGLASGSKIADIGGGAGNFSRILARAGFTVTLFDFKPEFEEPNLEARSVDLNTHWPAEDREYDCVISLEVIEHVENPRHFFREMARILRPGGKLLISTPNQHSVASKICFLLKGEHQHFQEGCYPAHITPLLRCDFGRIANEVGLKACEFHFSSHGRVPGTKVSWQTLIPPLGGQSFSDNILFSCEKSLT